MFLLVIGSFGDDVTLNVRTRVILVLLPVFPQGPEGELPGIVLIEGGFFLKGREFYLFVFI